MLARVVTLPLAIALLKRVHVQVAIDPDGPGALHLRCLLPRRKS